MNKFNKVVILGGTGFIGAQLATKLSPKSKKIIIPTRNTESNLGLKMIPNLEVVRTDIKDERSINLLFKDADLIINTVGILNEMNEDNSFDIIHYQLTKKISHSIKQNKVKRYLHISSLNADPKSIGKYLKSKGMAEDFLISETSSFCNLTIFRPSIVFGESDSFFNKFATLLKFLPIFPLACPNAKFMPVYVEDLTDFMISVINNIDSYGKKIDVTGPSEYTFRELIDHTLAALKIRRVIIPLNSFLSRLQASVFEKLPGKLFTMDNYQSLQIDSCSDEGFKGSSSLEDIIPQYLNIKTKQERFEKLRKKSGRK
ncbi:MAG: complex I NDUFA9 subunit family protein [Gammaproteobacteria bacterium]